VGSLPADPAGSNGMIYYNTASKDFRVFINDQWRALCCVSDGSCTAAEPACGKTTAGQDNCGGQCVRTGLACPVCVGDGSCNAPAPGCIKSTSGTDNCGNACTKAPVACIYRCGTCTVGGRWARRGGGGGSCSVAQGGGASCTTMTTTYSYSGSCQTDTCCARGACTATNGPCLNCY
jgi:hypothetical protein